MNRLQALAEQGQSVWLDFISKELIRSGELEDLVGKGLRGVTSNPTIFEKAISGTDDYVESIAEAAKAGLTAEEVYEKVAVQDIRNAADVLLSVHRDTDGRDGFVSLEVSPRLAHDTRGTIDEAKRLWSEVDRPNLMVKVPATEEGVPAIRHLISDGLNINVTLIFSLAQYEPVARAYVQGLRKRVASGKGIGRTASVASFFVSRVDTAVDKALGCVGRPELKGRAAVANAKLAYARFREIFSGGEWDEMAANGARVQRPLWASTGTKNPEYPDTLYIDSLIGSDTVNTIPRKTLVAFLDHGTVAPTLEAEVDAARSHINRLAGAGIDLDSVTSGLLAAGVESFAKSFDAVIECVAAQSGPRRCPHHAGECAKAS